MKIFVIAVATMLASCANLPMDLTKMTPEQMKAMKESSVSVQCATGASPWGKIETTMTTVDRNAVSPGTTSVKNNCGETVITVEQKPAKAASAP